MNHYQSSSSTLSRSKLLATNKSNPCPICFKTNGNCRINGELVLCMTYADGGDSPDYKFIGQTKDRLWGEYVPSREDWDKERRQAHQEKLIRQQQEREERDRAGYESGLSRKERDRNIRSIAAFVGLKESHRQDLLERGLTNREIDSGLYFSVAKGQGLPITISRKLPGVGYDYQDERPCFSQTKLKGYACPAFDKDGLAIGWQIRDEDPETNNKYLWAKSSYSSKLQNGELPITYIQSQVESSTLHLTEGILKPRVAALKHGLNCLGSSSANFVASPEQTLEIIVKVKPERLAIVPDGGDISNRHVMVKWETQIDFLRPITKELGIELVVAWWGQAGKEDGDLDEIESLQNLTYISPEAFFDLAKQELEKQDLIETTKIRQIKEGADIKAMDSSRTPAILRQKLENLIGQSKPESELKIILSYLAEDHGLTYLTIAQVYEEIAKELEYAELRDDIQREIDMTLWTIDSDIDLFQYLPEELASVLTRFSLNCGYKKAACLMAVVCASSICHTVGTRLFATAKTNWYVTPNCYGGYILPTGSRKSHFLKQLIRSPLGIINAELEQDFLKLQSEAQTEKSEYDLMKPDEKKYYLKEHGQPPVVPSRAKTLTTRISTEEGIKSQFRAYPEQGFMAVADELEGFLNYKNPGCENLRHLILSLYDGDGFESESRADELRLGVRQTLFGLFGCTHPTTLMNIMKDLDDTRGDWGRFMFVVEPRPILDFPEEVLDFDLPLYLSGMYQSVRQRPVTTFSLSPEAWSMFEFGYKPTAMKSLNDADHEALKSLWAKCDGLVMKLCLNLHVLNNNNGLYESVISEKTMINAINLAYFFIEQAKYLHSQMRARQGELSPKLVEIIRIAKSKGKAITARDIQRTSRVFGNRQGVGDEVRQYFRQLADLGYGKIEGVGNKLTFCV